jgi:hypothetical protein
MYAKSLYSLVILAFVALFASACSHYKEQAQAAIAQAETALEAISVDAQKYLPQKYQEVEDAITAAKASLDKGDAKDALAAAKDLPAQVAALGTEVAAAKQQAIATLTDSWNSLSADLPKMVEAIQSRVDTLSKSKKLPKGLDQASFDAAKSGLDEIKGLWSAAEQSFNSGNIEDAVAKANAVQQKGTEVMGLLGMKSAPAA